MHKFFSLLKTLWLTFYVVTTPFCACFAQTSNYYPDFISSYFYNMSLANPSYVPADVKADFALNYKFSTGAIKDISTTSFSGAYVWGQENTSSHLARVQVHNEQEGPYINYPRTYLNYAYRLNTGEYTQLSAGVCLGGMGIFFSAPSATTSIFQPDASLGLGFRYKTLSLGASSFQIFNAAVEPLLATIRFARYYQGNVEWEKELGLDWKSKMYVLWRLLPEVQDDALFTLSVVYKESFTLGALYRKQVGMAFFTSLQLNSEGNPLLLSFTYNSPFVSPNPRFQNSMELGLAYAIR